MSEKSQPMICNNKCVMARLYNNMEIPSILLAGERESVGHRWISLTKEK